MLKSRWSVTSLAVAICLLMLDSASAGYLGLANYRNCGIAEPESICESQVQTHTIINDLAITLRSPSPLACALIPVADIRIKPHTQ